MRTARTIAFIVLALAALTAPAQTATHVNDTSTTPAPPDGTLNVIPQNNGGAPTVTTSHYALYPTYQVNCEAWTDLGEAIEYVIVEHYTTNGRIIDARRCTGLTILHSNINIESPNTTVLLPCATISVNVAITVNAGANNARIIGCGYMGGSGNSGTQGGTTLVLGTALSMFNIGDPTYLTNTAGVEIADLSIVTSAGNSDAHAINLYDTQDVDLHDLLLNGSSSLSQIGLYLDGSGNYTGGRFDNLKIEGMGQALWMSGNFYDSETNATANASTFTRLHIVCPTSSGTPISGTYGIDLLGGDGNTFIGGDIESCDSMITLGPAASDNTFIGVRNEQNNMQITAESGSSYNQWKGGGTLFISKTTDAGTYNSFEDSFHHSINSLSGELWRSQADTTVTDHIDMGIGLGNVRGRQQEYETDVPGTPATYQYMWLWGPGDGTAGTVLWSLKDVLNNVQRFGVSQATTAGGNNQSFLNGSGTGSVGFNISANSGTGGVVFGSGGATPTQVGNIDSSGNLSIFGQFQFFTSDGLQWTFECNSDSVCAIHSAGATIPANVFRAFPNAGTEIDSQGSSPVTFNSTSTGGTGGIIVYEGGANSGVQLFKVAGTIASPDYVFYGLPAASGQHACLQVDDTGYLTTTGSACGTSSSPMVYPASGFAHSTGSAWDTPTSAEVQSLIGSNVYDAYGAASTAQSNAEAASDPTGAATTAQSNAETYSQNASNINTGTLPHAQLPALLSADIPNNAANTSGTAAQLASSPTTCGAANAPTGITANGNATGCAPLGTIQFSSSGTSLPTTGTAYMGIGYEGGNQNKGNFIAPRAGKVQNCYGAVAAAVTGTNYYTFTLWKNGSTCSGPTITINSGANVVQSDTTNTCTLAAGDRASWQIVATGTIPTADVGSVVCQF